MRIVVTGTSGAGKTTLARGIARRLELPHIELGAVNWQAGWRDLDRHDRGEFVRRVTGAIRAEAWVADGNYNSVRDALWRRATHLVWLDYERPEVMARVIGRSLWRVISRKELWAGTGNRERWSQLSRPSHPIRWAWNTWNTRRPRVPNAGDDGIPMPAYVIRSVLIDARDKPYWFHVSRCRSGHQSPMRIVRSGFVGIQGVPDSA